MHKRALLRVTGRPPGVAAAVVAVAVAALFALTAPAAHAGPYGVDGDPDLSTSSPAPGGSVVVGGDGFRAGSQVRVVIFSEPVVLGSTTANAAGEADLTVKIPSSFAAGSTHTLEMQGIDPSGEVRVLSQEITLAAAGEDSPSGDDGLAATGIAGTQLAVIAAGLLLAGVVLVSISRARRRAGARS